MNIVPPPIIEFATPLFTGVQVQVLTNSNYFISRLFAMDEQVLQVKRNGCSRNNQNWLSSIFISEQKLHYTFSFPQTGSNFSCIVSSSCPQMDAPPQCPPGYDEVRENSKCGLYCRDIVGYTWRCPCNDWMSCAVKERYLWGCADGYYSSFRVRECAQGLFLMYYSSLKIQI